jgi:hypothetical protein
VKHGKCRCLKPGHTAGTRSAALLAALTLVKHYFQADRLVWPTLPPVLAAWRIRRVRGALRGAASDGS